ncbi:MAG: hypothetical protein NC337_00595 [Roseburia sp.]|nr:hypothetical protein [Roseburia sp.]
MAKKFGKLVLFSALAGAAAAGTYHYLRNKKNDTLTDSDEFDDFDNFDEDLDDEDFSSESTEANAPKNRPHVSIDLDNAKGIIGEKVIETIDKAKERLDKAQEFIGEVTASGSGTAYTDMEMPAAADESKPETEELVKEETAQEGTGGEGQDKAADTEEFFDDSDEE